MTEMNEDILEEDSSQIAAEIIKSPAGDWLTEQYLPFTMYSIRSRALISDDGLKPVNRRILYSLFKNGVTPNSEHLKAARAAANAVAYHPHGSSSVEDALARMAQGFSMRIPLIDPFGSVGFVTGDTPAAARYWECRLSKEAMELLKELPEGAVPIGKNFDGKLDEPKQLPVRWPNNIINGTQGIAVGYSSNMYSHNPDEVMKAAISVLENPDLTVDQLLKIMPGPDLPTGGELFEVDGVKDYYETGTGRFIIRGKYNIEQMSRGKVKIIFYELPYQISAYAVKTKIREMQNKGKLKEIATVKDLSDKKNGLKLVIETKAGTNYKNILNEIFKITPAETTFSVNSTVLIDGSPTKLNMLQLLHRFVDFRRGCVLNKAKSRVEKINNRIYQLEAILAALIDIDKCIKIIRNAETSESARKDLMKSFKLKEDQAEYILSMQLRKLTKTDAVAVEQENAALVEERDLMNNIISSKEILDEEVKKELIETSKVISSKRLTTISGMTSDDLKEIAREKAQEARNVDKNLPCFVVRFANGKLMKTDDEFSYKDNIKNFENSPIVEQIKVKSQDSITLVSSDGLGHSIPLSYLPLNSVSTIASTGVNFKNGAKFVAIAKNSPLKGESGLMLATKNGEIKIVRPEFVDKEEYIVFNVSENDEIISGKWLARTLNNTFFVSISTDAAILIYDAQTIRATGLSAGGVRSQKLREGENVVWAGWINSLKNMSVISQTNKTIKATDLSEVPTKGKGSMGVILHKFKKGESKIIQSVAGENIIISVSKTNKSVNLPMITKRASTGVDFNLKTFIGFSNVNIM